MNVSELYQFVLLLVLIGLIIGVGALVLDKFASTAGVSHGAEVSLNASRDALAPIATDWMPLIVTVAVLSIILTLVVGSFMLSKR